MTESFHFPTFVFAAELFLLTVSFAKKAPVKKTCFYIFFKVMEFLDANVRNHLCGFLCTESLRALQSVSRRWQETVGTFVKTFCWKTFGAVSVFDACMKRWRCNKFFKKLHDESRCLECCLKYWSALGCAIGRNAVATGVSSIAIGNIN